PFFSGLPHCQIHCSMYPDILHQLYQGMLKHTITWFQAILGSRELDRCFQMAPPTHGARSFHNGLSHLTQVTGQE
ncbi:hypothetical protein CALCODRAFT_422829, partial [Calocera cornea HHB12733]